MAKEWQDEYLSAEHLILAYFTSGQALVKDLAALGLNNKNVKEKIMEIRGDNRVQDENPEGKYEALEKYGKNLNALAKEGFVVLVHDAFIRLFKSNTLQAPNRA